MEEKSSKNKIVTSQAAQPWQKFIVWSGYFGFLLSFNTRIEDLWTIAVAWILVDFIAGAYHWFCDSYRTKNPKINSFFFDNFQVHHELPTLITKHEWEWVNWETSTPACIWTWFFVFNPVFPFSTGQALFHFLCVWAAMTNQIHRWAHANTVPFLVQLFQDVGIFLSKKEHNLHHHHPQIKNYCITSGFNNAWLEATNFWERLETLIYYLTGAVSFRMAFKNPEKWKDSVFVENGKIASLIS